MKTAIPLNGDKIAGHFSKASCFGLFDDDGQLVGKCDNPAFNYNHCATKTSLINMLKSEQVTRIVVRHIGERMYQRLTEHGLAIFNPEPGHIQVSESIATLSLQPMSANMAQSSPNHHQTGHCCGRHADESCSCDHSHHQGEGCCQNHQSDGCGCH